LGLGPEEFKLKLVDLLARGFPAPDPTTGNYCFEAMQKWLRAQHPRQFPDENRLTPATARDAKDVVRARLAGGQSG
jgi:hypothetical protein